MKRKFALAACAVLTLAWVFGLGHAPRLGAAQLGRNSRILITEAIDESRLVTLAGNTRIEATAANDRGRVNDGFRMEHMLLQLKRPPEQEQALEQYIAELTDKTSPNYHHWLTSAELGQTYGPDPSDLIKVRGWLESHGFFVGHVYANGMVIDFSGTAGQVTEAFHTEIHNLDVNGRRHFANMSDPQIPEALSAIVVGVVSLHDFEPRSMAVPRTSYTFSGCGVNCYALVPADLETIYDLNPLYGENLLGQGQTIVVVEDSDTYMDDVATYLSTFLSKYSGTVTTTHPDPGNGSCTDPGATGADGEADLDAEVAAAVAPDASIQVAACTDTATFGGLIAIENILDVGNPPAVISMSYGECEVLTGSTANAAFYSAFQSAAAAGVSVFASAGDSGTAGCSPGFSSGSHYAFSGIGVTGWGESPYNVSVGGTDFEDTYNADEGGTPVSTYWASTNESSGGSAKAYIPEIPWSDSCASWLISSLEGYAAPYSTGTTTGFCNSSTATTKDAFLSTVAGGGGPSGCATGASNNPTLALVNGTCAGYAKPSWQSGIFGNPADGVRDVPDVSLFAGNGIWGHYVIVCFSDTSNGGSSCGGGLSTWAGFGGTSVAAPVMAAMQALVNQKTGSSHGNPDSVYYQIAGAEFGPSGNSACYSVNQVVRRGLASACVFYDVTEGDNNVNCRYNGTIHQGCYRPAGTYGVVGTQMLSAATVVSAGSGYSSAPSCSFGAPANLEAYSSPSGATIYSGGTQATCTAAISSNAVSSVTVTGGGEGYGGGAACTLSGGGGSGATCAGDISNTTGPSSYQPAFGAHPGWDFATGIGTVNAYNLVFSPYW